MEISEPRPENPYFYGGAIKDQHLFFGRARETKRILSCLSNKQCVSVVGPRRIGKSSLMWHLADPSVRSAHGLSGDFAFVYIDCQGLAGYTESSIYRFLIKEVTEAFEQEQSVVAPQAAMDFDTFKRLIDEITNKRRVVVFLFDEFEVMAARCSLGQDFFNRLRSLGQRGNVVYVTGSNKTLLDLSYGDLSVLGSPFFTIFSLEQLGLFDVTEAKELITEPSRRKSLEFSDDEIEFLSDLAGCHPAYLQIACSDLFEFKVEGQTLNDENRKRLLQKYKDETFDLWRHAWKQLEPDEQEAMELICKGQARRVGKGPLGALQRECLIDRNDRPFSPVFQEFVLEQPPSASGHAPNTTVREGLLRILNLFIGIAIVLTLVALALTAVFRVPFFVYVSAACLGASVILLLIRRFKE